MKLTKYSPGHVLIVAIVCGTVCYVTHEIMRYKLIVRAGEYVGQVKKVKP